MRAVVNLSRFADGNRYFFHLIRIVLHIRPSIGRFFIHTLSHTYHRQAPLNHYPVVLSSLFRNSSHNSPKFTPSPSHVQRVNATIEMKNLSSPSPESTSEQLKYAVQEPKLKIKKT